MLEGGACSSKGPILANDSDPDGDTLTIQSVTDPAHGTLTLPSGAPVLTYTPEPGFFGTDPFTYIVTDQQGGTDEATVTISINDPPVAFETPSRCHRSTSPVTSTSWTN